jgi:hypothetical protein
MNKIYKYNNFKDEVSAVSVSGGKFSLAIAGDQKAGIEGMILNQIS